MQRVVLALILAAIAVAIAAVLVRAAARAVERVSTSEAIATGGTMQTLAYFLLLCLILYVSVTGAA